nr:MAG TPA: hypothetical protein [Caudoviricetes sp.]
MLVILYMLLIEENLSQLPQTLNLELLALSLI